MYLNEKLNNLGESVADGKASVASAITAKGVTTSSDASFDIMATNISQITIGSYGQWKIDVGKIIGYDGNTKTWYEPNAPTGILVVYLTINEDGTWSAKAGAGSVSASKIS